MGASRLGKGAKVYISALSVAGLAAGVWLFVTSLAVPWDWYPILLLGMLAVAGPALSMTRQGYLPSRIAHQIGASFAYPLFFLAPPGAACIVLWAMALVDWALNRRKATTAVFNLGQFAIALAISTALRERVLPGFAPLADIDGGTVIYAALVLGAFALVNHALTHGVVSLVTRKPIHRLGLVSWPAVLVEVLCVVSGIGIAVFWQLDPALVPLGVIPIWALMMLLTELSRREQELRTRQEELHALQDLGLELGSELDAEKVRQAVVRIATSALRARGALLLTLDARRSRLVVLAHEGIEVPPPESVSVGSLGEEFLRAGVVRRIDDLPAQRASLPELEFLDAEGALCVPLEILGRREAFLALFHGPDRRRFDDDDVRRLETLARFVDVALSNAQLVRELHEMQEHLAQTEKMSAMGMLVSGVAHELNNPLTSVMGYAQLALSQEDDAAKRRMMERIVAESERAGKIVHHLLTFSRKRKPEKRLVNVHDILEQVLDLKETDLRLREVQVVRRFARNLPPVLVDAHQLQQVFLNLLQNAQDALEERRRRGRIVLETRDRGGWIQVLVSDDGPGIPAANIKKVFLPFFTTKGVGRGTGLGLAICYGILQEHGGRIEVDSRDGEGASFSVEIPTARARLEPDVPEPEIEPPPPPRSVGGRLLVVDDEEMIAEMVREAMEMDGWSVAAAKDGAEALDLLAEADFDVLLVDLRMPGMDGRAFFEELRVTRPELVRRVVFATGDTGAVETARFLEETGQIVLGKPYDLRDLAEVVSRVAGGSSQVH
jgi:signal transduction histidine kinase/ActR/RegA family two-component response regulator